MPKYPMQISGIFLIFCLDKSENVCYNNRVGGGICSWRPAETCGYPVDKSLLDRKTYIASVLHCLAQTVSNYLDLYLKKDLTNWSHSHYNGRGALGFAHRFLTRARGRRFFQMIMIIICIWPNDNDSHLQLRTILIWSWHESCFRCKSRRRMARPRFYVCVCPTLQSRPVPDFLRGSCSQTERRQFSQNKNKILICLRHLANAGQSP